jgi:hypothetical protein
MKRKQLKLKNIFILLTAILVFLILTLFFGFKFLTSETKIWQDQDKLNILPATKKTRVDIKSEMEKKELLKRIDKQAVNSDWDEYRAESLPIVLQKPKEFNVSENPIFHSLTVSSKQYTAYLSFNIYLTSYPENLSDFENREKAENTEPYKSDKWAREFNLKTASKLTTDDNKSFYYLKKDEAYYLFYPQEGRWSCFLTINGVDHLDKQTLEQFFKKIISGLEFTDINEENFKKYWSLPEEVPATDFNEAIELF